MQEYNKQNKKLARMAKRTLGNNDGYSDGRDMLKKILCWIETLGTISPLKVSCIGKYRKLPETF